MMSKASNSSDETSCAEQASSPTNTVETENRGCPKMKVTFSILGSYIGFPLSMETTNTPENDVPPLGTTIVIILRSTSITHRRSQCYPSCNFQNPSRTEYREMMSWVMLGTQS